MNDEPEFPCDPLVPFFAIYEAQDVAEIVPHGFNAVRLPLEGHLASGLEWNKEKQAALHYIERGLKIFWDIDLGFFHRLVYPIGQEMQFHSLLLSLEHFRDSLWREFRDFTVGLCIYSGSIDFSTNFPWDEQQRANFETWKKQRENVESKLFCADVIAEYFSLFARRLPDALTLFARLDTTALNDPALRVLLLNRERYNRIQLMVKGSSKIIQDFGWDDTPGRFGFIGRHTTSPAEHSAFAICLSSTSANGLSDIITALNQRSLQYRIIPESVLTTEWDGLDYLFFSPHRLSAEGKRKLQGFCAAGGTAVTACQKIGLPNEITLDEFLLHRAL